MARVILWFLYQIKMTEIVQQSKKTLNIIITIIIDPDVEVSLV